MHEHPVVVPFMPPRPFVYPVRVDPAGLAGPTPGAARGKAWRVVDEGLVVPAHADADLPEQRVAEAAALLDSHGAVTSWGNLLLRGARFLDGLKRDGVRRQPVALVLPPGQHRRKRDGVRFLQEPLGIIELVMGVPCVSAVRAVFDAIRLRRDLRDAVVDLDMTVAAGVVTLPELRDLLHSRRSWSGVPGVPRVRAALELADARSASPWETRARLVWVLDAGLPPPEVNVAIRDRTGQLIAVPDLFDPVAGVAFEYDGVHHRTARQHSDDVDREAEPRRLRIELTRATSRDVINEMRLAYRLRQAHARGLHESPDTRLWTWHPRDSVRVR